MSAYIEQEWLLDVVENIIQWDTERDRNRAIHQVRELTPVSDARIVVTCGECRHRNEMHRQQCQGRRPDWFCADGEKKR